MQQFFLIKNRKCDINELYFIINTMLLKLLIKTCMPNNKLQERKLIFNELY